MGAINPRTSFPSYQAVPGTSLGTAPLSTTSTAVAVPLASSGFKPSYFRLAISAGACHFRGGTDTSITAVTSDTIITSNEALWINSLGIGGLAFRQATASAGTANAVVTVTPLEEGALRPPGTGSPNTPGLG